jgi:hypothetical protein
MDSYISHISAALLWEIPFLHVVFGYRSLEDLKEALFVEQITSSSVNERVRRTTVQPHVSVLPLPKGSVVKLNGRKVAGPELVFLELASVLDFNRVVLLGMQLCSSKIGGESISSVAKIRRFLEKTQGHRGHKTASQAARYLADGSASVMESLLYMILTLPNLRGGYGLSGATLNQRISVENKQTSLSNKSVFVDLLWRKSKLAVEYDSYEYHNNANSWKKDAQRSVAIERLGYKVLSINTAQLYNSKALEEAAYIIAGHLGKRVRIRTKRFAEAHAELRRLLPGAS